MNTDGLLVVLTVHAVLNWFCARGCVHCDWTCVPPPPTHCVMGWLPTPASLQGWAWHAQVKSHWLLPF